MADQEGSLTASVGSIGAVAGNQAGMAADATIGPPLEGSPAGRWAMTGGSLIGLIIAIFRGMVTSKVAKK